MITVKFSPSYIPPPGCTGPMQQCLVGLDTTIVSVTYLLTFLLTASAHWCVDFIRCCGPIFSPLFRVHFL